MIPITVQMNWTILQLKKKKRFHFAKNYNLSPSSKCEETEVNLITYILGYKFVQCQFLKLA